MSTQPVNRLPFIQGGGEMGTLTRAFDWAGSPIGSPETWPQSLHTLVSLLLLSKFPMLLLWGPDLIQFYNDAFRPSLGTKGKHPAALGQRGEDCWPETWPVIKPLIDQVLAGGESVWLENQLIPIYRNEHPEDVYWTFSYSAAYDDLGQIAGVFITCAETTRQVQLHQTLLRSQEQFQHLLMYSPIAFALFRGPQFIIELANERVLEYWGRARDEVMNIPLFDALPEAAGQGFEELLMGVYTTGERYTANERTVTLERKGQLEQTYINFLYEPFREPDGTITGVTVVCVEVTEQVVARRKLQDEQNRLNTILNQMPVGVLMANATGELIYGNRQVEQIFRHPFRESRDIEAYANWQLVDPVTGKPFPLEAMPMVRTLLHGETVTGVEMKLRRGDDTWGYASVNTVPVYDSEGRLEYGVSAFVDITERKETEEALRQLEERYRSLFNSMDEGYYIFEMLFDADDKPFDVRIIEVNPAFEKLTGLRPAVGKTMRELVPAVEESWIEQFGMVALTGEPRRFDSQEGGLGSPWFDGYAFRLGDAQSRTVAVIFNDITERKRREANQAFLADIADVLSRLLTAEEIMQTVGAKIGQYLNLASVNFLDIDESQKKELTVSYFWGQPGVPILLGQYHIRDFLTEEFERACRAGETYVIHDTQTDPRTDAAAYASLAIGAYVNVPFHHRSRWTNIMAITDTQARMWRDDEIELFRDLANRIFPRLERARAEETLHNQQERTRIAIDAADMGTWEWNLLTDEVYWNEQHFWLFGMEPHTQPLTSDDFTRHVHPDDLDRVKAELERTIQEKVVYDTDFRAVRDDGTIRWMSGYGRVTGDTNGQTTRLSGVMFDIDDRKQSEAAMREADRRKDEFLATLAHELRNPLAPISNTLHILKLTAGADETVAQAVALMARQVDHLIHLVDDLLDVSRISQGKLRLRTERINLNEFIRQVVSVSRPLHETGGRTLTVNLPPEPIFLTGDTTRLTQIINNLLNNAAKFTHEGGHIWLIVEQVDAETGGKEILLRVRDDGIGIAADQLESIFDLFNQANNTLERSQGGLGLGLTLVRQLVGLHGGRVKAQSTGLNQGSDFRVYLPLLTEAPAPPPDRKSKQPTNSRQILVIDDNRDAATTLVMLLKLKGHRAQARYGGLEGAEAAESLRPGVILLDIGMPGLNGYDTCRLIRRQPWGQSMVLIALTGFGQEEDKQLSREAGFDAHLVKPVDIPALLQLLDSLPAERSTT